MSILPSENFCLGFSFYCKYSSKKIVLHFKQDDKMLVQSLHCAQYMTLRERIDGGKNHDFNGE